MDTTVPGVPVGAGLSIGARYGRFVVEKAIGSGGMGVVLLAKDPALDRFVALKLLRPDLARADGHARLVREAQAMAKLAHPNVVTVFEVGSDGEQVFVAMELVEGTTLRGWLATPRPWRDVVTMFIAAGRGLCAAHDAGLVHRDFKPENVLIGGDGRPRVSDFGLAGELTGVAGTPAYMSPEQWAGGEVDARADQFSFCKALGAALGDDAPAWIAPIVQRGIEPRAGDRWPTLAVVLDQLAARTTTNRKLLVGFSIGGVAFAGGAIALALATRGAGGDPCLSPTAPVLTATQRSEIQTAMTSADPALGAKRFAAAADVIDRGEAALRTETVAACRAARPEVTACLAHWRSDATRLAGELRATSHAAVDDAIASLVELPHPSTCATATRVPPQAKALLDELDRLAIARRRGDLRDAVPRATALVDRARMLDHAPSLAATLYAVAQFLSRANAVDEKLLEELTRVAASAGEDYLVAYAWVHLVKERGSTKDRPEQAEALYATADAALIRVKDPPALRFDLDLAQATVLRELGRFDDASAMIDAATSLIPKADPAERTDRESRIAFARARLLDARRLRPEAIAEYRKALGLRTEMLGPDHPDLATTLINIGEVQRQMKNFDDAEATYREAARILEERVGESGVLAMAIDRLASVERARGKHVEALVLYRRAAAMGDAHLPPDHATRSMLHTDLGTALASMDKLEDALVEQSAALASDEAGKRTSVNVAIAYHTRGQTQFALDHLDDAIADYRRALAMLEKLGDVEYRDRFTGDLAHALVELERYAEALPILESIAPKDGATAVQWRYDLGRAKVGTKRDVPGGLADVRAARAAAMAAKLPPDAIAEIDDWLAKPR